MAFQQKERGLTPDLTFEEQVELAFAKIIRCANAKEQSTVKMKEKLIYAGFAEQAAEAALERAMRLHIIDDIRYAECLIRSALSQGKGLQFVVKEIESLEIDIYELEAYQDYLRDHAEAMTERALQYLRQHRCHSKNPKASCYRKLMSRGYGSRVAAEAAELYCEELSCSKAY